jgi:TolB protein
MRRLLWIAAVALAALGSGVALAGSSHDRNGRIAFAHHTFPGDVETSDIATISSDGTDLRVLTTNPPGTFSDDPAWAERGNRIYFDSDQAGNVHLFTIKADGRDQRQLTRTDGWEFSPALSREDRLLAFEHDNADFTSGGIFVSDRRGGGLDDFRQVTSAPGLAAGGFDGYPAFSPDGRQIAFMRVIDVTHGSAQSAIFVVGVDGRGLRQLTPYPLDAAGPVWSPDGRTIAFATNDDNFPTQAQIDTVDVRTGAITQLTHDPLPNQNFSPEWSPDGTKILFDRWMGLSHFDLMVMSPDGSHLTTLWHGIDGTFDFHPAWGPRPDEHER